MDPLLTGKAEGKLEGLHRWDEGCTDWSLGLRLSSGPPRPSCTNGSVTEIALPLGVHT